MKLSKGWAIVFVFGSLALILGLAYGATLLEFPYLVNLPMALVAWGTLMLALATFQMITNSNEREKRRRKEELSKERRDKDERLLNEIIEWAIEIVKVGMPIESAVFVGKMDKEAEQRLVLNSLGSLRNNFRAMIAISLYVSRIGLAFGGKLQSSIATLDGYLRKQEDIIGKCQKIVIERKLSEFNEAWDELINNWETLGDSSANVIDEAVIEKFTILNT